MGLLSPRSLVFLVLSLVLAVIIYQSALSLYLYLDGARGLAGIRHHDNPAFPVAGQPTRIPKKLHQTWKSTDLSTYPLNATYDAWKRTLPAGFEIRLWTDLEVEDLIKAKYPFLLPTFKGYPYNIQRADMARYVILHHEGGIYADLDCAPNRLPVTQLLSAQLVVVATWQEQGLSNHFLAAEKNSGILEKALLEAKRHDRWIALPYLRVFASTGPLFLTTIIREYQEENPNEPPDLLVLGSVQGMAYCFHHAGRSWHMLDGYILNYIVEHKEAPLYLAIFLFALCGGVLCLLRRLRSFGVPQKL